MKNYFYIQYKFVLIIIYLFIGIFLLKSQNKIAPPQGVNYQAVAIKRHSDFSYGYDKKDLLIKEEDIKVRFTINHPNPNSNSYYVEEHYTQTDPYGMFSLILGKGLKVGGKYSFNKINWSLGNFHLKVEINFKGTKKFYLSSIQPIYSVPYALYSSISNSTKVVDEGNEDGQILTWDDNQKKWIPNNIAKGNIIIGSQNNKIKKVTVFGDATLDINGKLKITDNAITSNKIDKMNALDNQFLMWSSKHNSWIPKHIVSSTMNVIGVGNIIIGDNKGLISSVKLSGDASIDYNGIFKLNKKGASNGDILAWNGYEWNPKNNDFLNLDNAKIFIGNSLNFPQARTVKGDISLDSYGTMTIKNSSITSFKIAQMNANKDDILAWDGIKWTPKKFKTSSNINLNSGKILVGNGDNIAKAVTMTGDAIIDTNGTFTINSGSITSNKLNRMGAKNNQILIWSNTNSSWLPSNIPSRSSTLPSIINNNNHGISLNDIFKNTGFGYNAMYKRTTGHNNTALGYEALKNNENGSHNIAIGYKALDSIPSGSGNIAIGTNSIGELKIGNKNIALGTRSLGSLATGEDNIAIGYSTGSTIQNGKNNILIGSVDAMGSLNNRLVISSPKSGVSSSHLIEGYFDKDSLIINGDLKITGNLTLGGFFIPSISIISDKRLKKNIENIKDPLKKIKDINGLKFEYNSNVKGFDYLPPGKRLGFIAQDVEKILPEVIRTFTKNGISYKKINYEDMIAILLEAIKVQQKHIEDISSKLEELESKIE